MELTYPEQQDLKERIKKLQDTIVGFEKAKVRIVNEEIPKNLTKEVTNKKIYDNYNNTIASYELEIKQLNSTFISAPINETDFSNRVNSTGRLYDINERELVRVSEFDGGGTTTSGDNENTYWPKYSPHFVRLQSGLTTSLNYDTDFFSTVTSASTYILVSALSLPPVVNKEFICYSYPATGKSFIGLCTSVEDDIGSTYKIYFNFITTIDAPITGGKLNFAWSGFSNNERATKQATQFNGALQTIMEYFISQLRSVVTAQLPYLNTQKAALLANETTPTNTTALNNVNNTLSFLNNFNSVTDISDSGVANFNSFKNTRQTQISSRITEATNAKSSYYGKRFDWAIQRAGSKGTMTIDKGLNDSIVNINNQIAKAQADIAVLQNP